MIELTEAVFGVHDALVAADIPHAFGGALALAYCIEEPRATRDVDLNIFVEIAEADRTLSILPTNIVVTPEHRKTANRDGQLRLAWGTTPVDIFFNTTDFHRELIRSIRHVPMYDRTVPILSCQALAVFKGMFNRAKDWLDIQTMAEASTIDLRDLLAQLTSFVGNDDPRAIRLRTFLD